jgi:hypothetical protein
MPSAEAQRAVLEALLTWASDERRFSLLTASVGAVALLAATVVWLGWARPWALGAAVPLALLGVVDLAAGSFQFLSTSRDLDVFPAWVREAPHLVDDETRPRLEARVAAAQVLTGVSGGLALVGLVLCARPGRWRGGGVALLLVCSADVALERLALARAERALSVLSANALTP